MWNYALRLLIYLSIFVADVSLTKSSCSDIGDSRICQMGNDTLLNECLMVTMCSTRPAMYDGIPSQNIPHLDPYYIDELNFEYGDTLISIKGIMKNTRVEGIGKFDVNSSKTESKLGRFLTKIKIPYLKMNGTYFIHVRFIALGLKGTGTFEMLFDDITVNGINRLVNKGKYVQVSDIKQKVKARNGNIKLHDLFKEEPFIGEVCHEYLNSNWEELFDILSPKVMDVLAEIQKQILNYMLYQNAVEQNR